MNINEAWGKLFDKYKILDEINKKGFYIIKTETIKEFNEPRLMAKFDSSLKLPEIFKQYNINILPISKKKYILSNFKLYEYIGELGENNKHNIERITIEHNYQSVNINNISSESSAIMSLILTKTLDNFLVEDNNTMTFFGRMWTKNFDFFVDKIDNKSMKIEVNNSQCEIDAGLENKKSLVILEAKLSSDPDFNIRQLYYPFRLWSNKVEKPIRLVFISYFNQIFRLFEYKFEDINNLSSIKLIKQKSYSLYDTKITLDDIYKVFLETKVIYTDNQYESNTVFIQADSFWRIIDILEFLSRKNKTKRQIAQMMNFTDRQADYYFNAGKYLKLWDKNKNTKQVFLTNTAKKIVKLNYKQRQLKLVSLILEHKIFNELFIQTYINHQFPTKEQIVNIMLENNVCSKNLVERRSNSVFAWIKWIFNLTNI
ncbi:type II restriction enzyme [Mycoplasma mycoides]|uniref:type II restriction enzyme n=1 Tax=Mycoplasma mycoides TaxID=2102 RepID=UPI0027355CC2|nr:type II restriction endonuclease [Mycoplasma mycoides]MDP4040834.1 type II restriction endonuclease [Mycoplasma mycoides]MDP4041708.1 type II restriction endonuclease [Mycoplasma mycoides]MDP4042606.1 type II restriction endonuclease [Mycoplasma mycoides]MDP4044069.1 type II restriction endonuclease [Mycoplasma mycoides]MDP4044940.1 type II restriction endonuclease [Mycoplasma mycoides]